MNKDELETAMKNAVVIGTKQMRHDQEDWYLGKKTPEHQQWIDLMTDISSHPGIAEQWAAFQAYRRLAKDEGE